MCKNIKDTKLLISEINNIHKVFSREYFEQYKLSGDIINLSRTIKNVPIEYILKYRLNLHESINDYLMNANLDNITYWYRVKTGESILAKIERYSSNTDQFPVINWMNDIFGCRVILNTEEIDKVVENLDGWQEEFGLKNWYYRNKQGYKGYHVYFKNRDNHYFPWELQIWDEKEKEANIKSHRDYKRSFLAE
jgi:hypothetical protein